MHLLLNGLVFNLSWFFIVGSQNAAIAWPVATAHVLLHAFSGLR